MTPAWLTLAVTPVATALTILGLRRWKVIDVPNVRSLHTAPTPRGGGLGIVAGVVPAVLLTGVLAGGTGTEFLVVALGFAAIGLLDDVVHISPLFRLPGQFVPAVACLPWLLTGLDGSTLRLALLWLLVALWLVAFVNAFNFMDGINGLAVGQVIVAGAAWFVVGRVEDLPWLAAVAAIAVAAGVGFAPFNFPRARVFLGDVGSYFLGGLLGAAAVAGLRTHVPPEAMLAPLAIFLADTARTLLRRIARGERWYEPHREHVYQELASLRSPEQSATAVTLVVVAAVAVCSALGCLSLVGSTPLRVAADGCLAVMVAAYLALPEFVARRQRRSAAALRTREWLDVPSFDSKAY